MRARWRGSTPLSIIATHSKTRSCKHSDKLKWKLMTFKFTTFEAFYHSLETIFSHQVCLDSRATVAQCALFNLTSLTVRHTEWTFYTLTKQLVHDWILSPKNSGWPPGHLSTHDCPKWTTITAVVSTSWTLGDSIDVRAIPRITSVVALSETLCRKITCHLTSAPFSP